MPASPFESRVVLPPPFELAVLQDGGDAFAEAQRRAAAVGAGTVFLASHPHRAEFALVLEPDEPLATARGVVYAAANALYNALSVHAPPQFPMTYDWPATLRFDDIVVGGVRLAWPRDAAEATVPDWLVVGVMVRLEGPCIDGADEHAASGGLCEYGFEEMGAGQVVEGFCRQFVREVGERATEGTEAVAARWRLRAEDEAIVIRPNGDGERSGERLSLADALAKAAWLEDKTGKLHL